MLLLHICELISHAVVGCFPAKRVDFQSAGAGSSAMTVWSRMSRII